MKYKSIYGIYEQARLAFCNKIAGRRLEAKSLLTLMTSMFCKRYMVKTTEWPMHSFPLIKGKQSIVTYLAINRCSAHWATSILWFVLSNISAIDLRIRRCRTVELSARSKGSYKMVKFGSAASPGDLVLVILPSKRARMGLNVERNHLAKFLI